MKKLNLGCGRHRLDGFVNVDSIALPSVDLVADLEQCATTPLPFEDDSIDEMLLAHVIEHIRSPLPLMQELWRIAKVGCKLTIRVPYGHSDDAWEDPTHVRPYFLNSFGYFSQPFYWRADYGYRGDWLTERIVLSLRRAEHERLDPQSIMARVMSARNVVTEMVAILTPVKPARPPDRALQVAPHIELALLD